MKLFENKILLITGGTGSFGNAVLKKFLKMGLQEIRIFSRDEKKQDEMRKLYELKNFNFILEMFVIVGLSQMLCVTSITFSMQLH